MVIYYKNLQEKKNVNLSAKLFLIYNNKTDYFIEENNYISDKLLTQNTNNYFNLYHLKLNGDNDKFIIDFSSNYALGRGLYVSFFDDLKINAAIINRNILNRINTDISDNSVFNNTLISASFDLTSKSIALSLDKQSIYNNWNSLNNKDRD